MGSSEGTRVDNGSRLNQQPHSHTATQPRRHTDTQTHRRTHDSARMQQDRRRSGLQLGCTATLASATLPVAWGESEGGGRGAWPAWDLSIL